MNKKYKLLLYEYEIFILDAAKKCAGKKPLGVKLGFDGSYIRKSLNKKSLNQLKKIANQI